MKSKYHFPATAIIAAIFFIGCEKDTISYGTVNVSVMYQNRVLPCAKIYLKQGAISNPNIPLSQYDGLLTADADGLATFAHLAPDGYFFMAQGFWVDSNRNVSGSGSLKVLQRSRGTNEYSLKLNTN